VICGRVSGSQTLPVTYPIGTTVTMPMEDDKGTRPGRISDGERCVIVGVVAEDVPMSVASSKRPTPPESHVHLYEDKGLLDNAVAAAPAASDTISPPDAANRVVAPGAAAPIAATEVSISTMSRQRTSTVTLLDWTVDSTAKPLH
jgi:hypothetical protein